MSRAESHLKCVTCGDDLHPERARKYDYCMKPECQAKNLKGLTMVAVGVNKSAEQYMLLDDDTRADLARGKYHDQRRGTFGQPERAPVQPEAQRGRHRAAAAPARTAPRAGQPAAVPPRAARPQPAPHPGNRGCRARRRSAGWPLLYNQQGLRPDEIARKLGLSRYDVTQIILAARGRGKA